MLAANSVNIAMQEALNQGNIVAGNQFDIKGQRFDNQANVFATNEKFVLSEQLNNHGNIQSQQLAINTHSLQNQGNIFANTLAVQASARINNTGQISAEHAQINSQTIDNQSRIESKGTLSVQTQALNNQSEGIILADTLQVSAEQQVDNSGVLKQTGEQGLLIQTQQLDNLGKIGLEKTTQNQSSVTNTPSSTAQTQGFLHTQQLNNQGIVCRKS